MRRESREVRRVSRQRDRLQSVPVPEEHATAPLGEPKRPGSEQILRGAGPNLGIIALATLALVWGYNWVVMKIGLRYSQPFTFAALRSSLGAVVLFVLLPVLHRPLRPRALGLTLLIGLLQTTGEVGLIMWALESGGAARTSVLTYTMPFWLLLLAWVVLGERLRGLQWLAVGLAFGVRGSQSRDTRA